MAEPKNGLVLIVKPKGGVLTVSPDGRVVGEVKQLAATFPIAKQRQQQPLKFKLLITIQH